MQTIIVFATILACANAGIIAQYLIPGPQGQTVGSVRFARYGAARSTRSVSDEVASEESNMDGLMDPKVQPIAYSVIPAPYGAPLIAQPWMTTLGYSSAPVWAARPAVTFAQQSLMTPWAYSTGPVVSA